METFEALRERVPRPVRGARTHRTEGRVGPGAGVPSVILVMAEVELRETIDGDLGTLFEFQADPDASAMAAFPPRDLPAFLEHQGKIKADPFVIDADQQRFRVFDSLATVLRKASRGLSSHRGHGNGSVIEERRRS